MSNTSAPAGELSPRNRSASRGRAARAAVALLAVVAIAPNLLGVPYYILTIGERVRHPLHAWFKPSGYVGQSAGILTLALFLFMYLYPLRKRVRWLASFGHQARWLRVHIAAGLVIPFIGATHSSWRFHGLIGLGYLAMLMVSLSGVAGRYLYTRMPRSGSGRELTEDELVGRERDLEQRISSACGVSIDQVRTGFEARVEGPPGGLLSTLRCMVRDDFRRRGTVRSLSRLWQNDPAKRQVVARLIRERVALGQQHSMLDATRRLFGYWHVIHRPFSVTSFVAVAIHVVVVVTLGVTWF